MVKRDTYYLTVRPIATSADDIEALLGECAEATGFDHATLRQKLTGSSLNVLISSVDKRELEALSKRFKSAGVSTAVLSKRDIRARVMGARAAGIGPGGRLTLVDAGGAEILSFDRSLPTLIVIATREFRRINAKRLTRRAMRSSSPLSKEEILTFIFRNSPVMDLYHGDSGHPVRIDAARFNFTTLGEKNMNAAALNLPVIIKEIAASSSEILIDTGFGEVSLPFLVSMGDSVKERAFRSFSAYSRFVFLANRSAIFSRPAQDAGVYIPVFSELGGLFWGGPILPGGARRTGDKPGGGRAGSVRPEALPPPPDGLVTGGSSSRFRALPKRYVKIVRGLGPSFVFYPLTMLLILSLLTAHLMGRHEPLYPGLVFLGLILYSHAFVLFKRKRSIENRPTSKIRSMPMGEVEVKGRAGAKYFLRSPYTHTDCVYYSYKVYERRRTSKGTAEVLVEWGSSGSVPFYLEDEEARVTVLPESATIHGGRSETIRGDMLSSLGGLPFHRSSASGRRVVETVIPVGETLYVLGYARRLLKSGTDKLIIERLKSLKDDREGLYASYDADSDGKLSQDEWEVARREAEEYVIAEKLAEGVGRDLVAIGEHPAGGLFYISDRKEERIVSSLALKAPIAFIAGSALVIFGSYFVLQVAGNEDILLELSESVRRLAGL